MTLGHRARLAIPNKPLLRPRMSFSSENSMTQSIPITLAQTCRPNCNLLSKEVMERKCSQLGLFGGGARSSRLVVRMGLRLCALMYPIPTRPVVAPKGAETATLLGNAAWTSNSQAAETAGYPGLLLSTRVWTWVIG